jgi:hypothetical protein
VSQERKVSREEQMEQENEAFLALQREARLRGSPNGEDRCDNCRYLVGVYKEIGYCNHPKLEILVGNDWWCQWWEKKED